MDFIQALKRPYACWREFLLFSIFYLVPIANFFSMGYALRAAKTAMQGRPLEEWTDWGLYFRWGFFHFVISFVYMLPLLFLMAGGVLAGILAGFRGGGLGVFIVVLFLVPLVLVVAVVSVYLRWAGLMAFADTCRLGAAFDLRAVWRRAFTAAFFIGWLQQIAVSMVYGLVIVPFLVPLLVLDALTGSLGVALLRVVVQAFLMAIISYPITITGMSLLGVAYKQAGGRR